MMIQTICAALNVAGNLLILFAICKSYFLWVDMVKKQGELDLKCFYLQNAVENLNKKIEGIKNDFRIPTK